MRYSSSYPAAMRDASGTVASQLPGAENILAPASAQKVYGAMPARHSSWN